MLFNMLFLLQHGYSIYKLYTDLYITRTCASTQVVCKLDLIQMSFTYPKIPKDMD